MFDLSHNDPESGNRHLVLINSWYYMPLKDIFNYNAHCPYTVIILVYLFMPCLTDAMYSQVYIKTTLFWISITIGLTHLIYSLKIGIETMNARMNLATCHG
jgi:hypothetical protein